MTSSSSCEPHSGSSGGPSEESSDSASSPRGALRRPDGAPFASSSRSSSSASPSLPRRFSRSSSRSSDSCRAVVSARSSARVSCDGVWTVEGGQTARARGDRGRLGRHEIDLRRARVVGSFGDERIWLLRAHLARGALGVAESLRAGHRPPELVAPHRGQGPEQTQELLGARHGTNESPRLTKTEGATVGRYHWTWEAAGSKSLCSIFAIPAEPRLGSAPFLRVLFARSNLASTLPSSRSIPPRITPRRAPPRGPPRRQPPPRQTRVNLTCDPRLVRTRP